MNALLIIALQKYAAGPADSFELSEALCRLGVCHSMIMSAGNELRAKWKAHSRRRIFFVPTFESRFLNFCVATFTLVRPAILFWLVFRLRPRVVHVMDFHPWIIFAFFAAKLRGAKFIYTLHDNPFAPKERGLSRLASRIERYFARAADVVMTHSHYIRGEVSQYLRGKKFAVMPLGAYTHLCAAPAPVRPSSGACRFLFLGRIEPYKGLDVLLAAYALLRDRVGVGAVSLTVAGRGVISAPLKDEMRRQGVQLINRWLSVGELCELMQNADVVVLPYRQATQSGVISLALAYDVPVIASRIGGLVEQVRDGESGLLFEAGDAKDLAEKMEMLVNDRARLEELRRGSARLKETVLNWDISARILLDVIKGFGVSWEKP